MIFGSGLLGRLEEAGVQGRVLSVRLARSLQDFRADSLGRAEGYAAMEELADAALAFHAFLEEHAASLRFAAAAAGDGAGIRRGADMDDVVREGLRDGVQRVLAALEALAGPDPRRRAEVMQEIDVFLDGAPPPG